MLPKALKTSTVPNDTNFQGCESEKKQLRSSFGCFTSISMHQREVSISSLFLHSHYKGCLPPWELKGSKSRSMKERWQKLIFVSLLPFFNPGERIHFWQKRRFAVSTFDSVDLYVKFRGIHCACDSTIAVHRNSSRLHNYFFLVYLAFYGFVI